MDCGPACICMIAEHYGKQFNIETLRNYAFISRDGVSMLGLSKVAEKIGFHSIGGYMKFEVLVNRAVMPCIVH